MSFAELKDLHQEYGHDVFARGAIESGITHASVVNVCTDLNCKKKDEHIWERHPFKDNVAMKCLVCGFIWQPHMYRPRVTCEQILNNPRKRDPRLNRKKSSVS